MTEASAPLRVPGVSDALAARLADGLAAVNDLLAARVDHDDPFIASAGGHLLGGGKRTRPLLCLMAADLGPKGINDDVVTAAAAVELTHLASLYHDDVMDEAAVRHGHPSVNAAYGNSTAILVGDLLFGTASELVSELGPDAVKIQAQTFVRLCAGQIRDDRPTPGDRDPVDYYLDVLADKTGVLIATAARYGAMFGGSSPDVVDRLREYGERLGIAFQLADDLLDIASDTSGKTPGTDLREGKPTLPVLYLRAAGAPDDAELLSLTSGPLDDAGVARALELLRPHPALERARQATYAVGEQAREVLAPLPPSDAKDALVGLVGQVVDRTR